jgi:hypothetical protein
MSIRNPKARQKARDEYEAILAAQEEHEINNQPLPCVLRLCIDGLWCWVSVSKRAFWEGVTPEQTKLAFLCAHEDVAETLTARYGLELDSAGNLYAVLDGKKIPIGEPYTALTVRFLNSQLEPAPKEDIEDDQQ